MTKIPKSESSCYALFAFFAANSFLHIPPLRAGLTSFSPTGPHKNSAQAIELIPTSVFDLNQVRNFMSSVELRTSARIKKPVSRWIIAYEQVVATMMRDAQRAL